MLVYDRWFERIALEIKATPHLKDEVSALIPYFKIALKQGTSFYMKNR